MSLHFTLVDQAFDHLFADIPMPKHPLDHEQAAPLVQPEHDLIETVRAGIARVKLQHEEASCP
jgi:hypothetical protein